LIQFFFNFELKVLLAYNLRFGIDCKQDLKKAEEYCMLACSQGSKLALGMKYLFGWQCVTNDNKAFQIFKEIVEENKKGNEEEIKRSLFFIGRCHDNANGTEKNIERAIEFYEKASEMEEYCSINNLANIHYFEEGYKDINKTMKLFEKAIKLGDEIGNGIIFLKKNINPIKILEKQNSHDQFR
jgi:uncharacterized protein